MAGDEEEVYDKKPRRYAEDNRAAVNWVIVRESVELPDRRTPGLSPLSVRSSNLKPK